MYHHEWNMYPKTNFSSEQATAIDEVIDAWTGLDGEKMCDLVDWDNYDDPEEDTFIARFVNVRGQHIKPLVTLIGLVHDEPRVSRLIEQLISGEMK